MMWHSMIMHILAYTGLVIGAVIIFVVSGFIVVIGYAMYKDIDMMVKDPIPKQLYKACVVVSVFMLVAICVVLGLVVATGSFILCGITV